MAALFLAFGVFLLFLAFVAGLVYVVCTVRDHMAKSPAAAKAIYDHVFLPVFIGSFEPEKTEEEPNEITTIDPADFKL
ncbi:MAG: hypothetical protein ABGY75_20210 [Gemmataceae bacterium]